MATPFRNGFLQGRPALFTGGGNSIGRGIALAGAVGCVCSDAAAFITGVTLAVEGGRWLRSTRLLEAADAAAGS